MKLGDITSEEYRARVEEGCTFLDGQSKEALAALEEEMRDAAAKLDFERAAELRNMLVDLRRTTKPMARYTREMRGRLRTHSAIDPESDLTGLAEALGLQAPPRRMECFDISNISTTHIVASMVCFIDGRPANQLYRRFRIRTVEGQDDFASMAEVVRRRYARVLREVGTAVPGEGTESDPIDTTIDYSAEHSQEPPAEIASRLASLNPDLPPHTRLPNLIIVDGGKGQLGAACKELQRLGLYDQPIIGLAKEFEEIHRPGRALPLRLPTTAVP
jgi:excinuclease ABC subunit C